MAVKKKTVLDFDPKPTASDGDHLPYWGVSNGKMVRKTFAQLVAWLKTKLDGYYTTFTDLADSAADSLDDAVTATNAIIFGLKGGVPSAGDTLKKLYDLINGYKFPVFLDGALTVTDKIPVNDVACTLIKISFSSDFATVHYSLNGGASTPVVNGAVINVAAIAGSNIVFTVTYAAGKNSGSVWVHYTQ